jgi:hypothetical protein
MSARIVASALVAVALGNVAQGQQLVGTDQGQVAGRYLGGAIAGGPDIDGDGIGEMAVGGTGSVTGTVGIVHVLRGSDFSKKAALLGALNENFGSSVAWCGDLDGDGRSDLAVGATGVGNGVGEVRIFSTKNWKLIRTLSVSGSDGLGWALAPAGDVDGDGFDDLLVGERGESNNGTVTLFSGKDGSVLQSITSTVAQSGFGQSIAVVGDANGDGIADYAIGSPYLDVTTYDDNAGAVDLRSGADGSLLWQQQGSYYTFTDSFGTVFYVGDQLGYTVDGAGDVDGDGARDVVAATWGASYTPIYSGKDGSTLRSFTPPWSTVGAVAALGDLTGDGLPEIGVNYGGYDTTFVIYSSLDGKVLWRTDYYMAAPEKIATAPDVDGDGLPDFLLGLPRDSISWNGRAELWTSSDLWLDITTHHPGLFSPTLELRANEGPAGNLAALALTGVNGTPLFQILTIVPFDATGSALFYSGSVPGGLSGTVLELRALAIDAHGKLIQSADETFAPQ